MPICINLLAEEQAAEEMRRRDPVKRAVIIGAALFVLMLGWIGVTQMNVSAAKHELTDLEARLRAVDDSSKQVRSNQFALAESETKLKALEKYSRNRFFWATFLDNVQKASVENVRLMEIRADQKYLAGDVTKFLTTNVTVKFTPPASSLAFWKKKTPQVPILTLVSNAFASITNKPPFTTNLLSYDVKITLLSTNAADKSVTARAEFSNPHWAMERSIVEIRGRDYAAPAGSSVDELARQVNRSTYFKDVLEPEEGFRFTERPPQPRPDPTDPVNPNSLFVPFTIELTLKERVLAND